MIDKELVKGIEKRIVQLRDQIENLNPMIRPQDYAYRYIDVMRDMGEQVYKKLTGKSFE